MTQLREQLSATTRLEKRNLELELSKREETAMDHSFHVESKILEVIKLMDRPAIDPLVKSNYIAVLERYNKKQRMIDDRIEEIRKRKEYDSDSDSTRCDPGRR